MFSFLKKEVKKELTTLVCLVTSYSVVAAVVKTYHKPGTINRPVVLFYAESIIPDRYQGDRSRLEKFVAEAALKTLNMCRTYCPVYDRLICSIGEPWVTISTRTAHLERNESFLVTAKVVSDLVARETKLFEQEIIQNLDLNDDLGVLEISLPLVDVNGYRTDHYLKAVVQTLDVHISFSLAKGSIIDHMLGIFADVFHRTDVIFESYDIAKAKLFDGYHQGTLIELGGLNSAVTLFEKNIPAYFALIPTGVHSIEQSLVDAFNIKRHSLSKVMSFVHDENILEHERDIYFTRIVSAYQSQGNAFSKYIFDIKKYVQKFEEPVMVIGHPLWLRALGSLVENDIGSPVVFPSVQRFSDQLVITHDAYGITLPLLLSVIHASR
jgi:hypothetical protein